MKSGATFYDVEIFELFLIKIKFIMRVRPVVGIKYNQETALTIKRNKRLLLISHITHHTSFFFF
jgi:hypothetical protein